jgi:hypothetical protein
MMPVDVSFIVRAKKKEYGRLVHLEGRQPGKTTKISLTNCHIE